MGRRTGDRRGPRGASRVNCGDAPTGAPPAPRAGDTPPANSGAGGAPGESRAATVESAAPSLANFGAEGEAGESGAVTVPSAVPPVANIGAGGALGETGAAAVPPDAPPLVNCGAAGAPGEADGPTARASPAGAAGTVRRTAPAAGKPAAEQGMWAPAF